MNQKHLSGFAATLLISALGLAPSGYANQSGLLNQLESADENSEVHDHGASTNQASSSIANPLVEGGLTNQSTATTSEPTLAPAIERLNELTSTSEEKVPTPADSLATETAPASTAPDLASPQPNGDQSVEVVKVGEYQTHEALRQTASSAEATVATIQPHPLQGRQAATLYVRNIPVLTFLGETAPGEVTPTESSPAATSEDGAQVKIASVQSTSADLNQPAQVDQPAAVNEQNSNDPVWRATATAARLNQLHRENISASDIRIVWDDDRRKYVIRAEDIEIVAVDDNTVLPDTIANASNDMLQATNRIRRQMGNASPLSNIEGDPNSVGRISFGPIQLTASGFASWYGPGFDGNYSASGEVFNQNAMTAAHPSLPFGTQVRVTNLDNGQSVVVRINDRGPYAHGRVIDLSAGAARIIGLVSSGVAPVSLEVLGAAQMGTN